ncbi:MAG: DUF2306 domain-containing protein [Caulobacter sp.]|nr:DUF2306 domain-containing protein [Caulobacter sp.]
MSVTPSRPSEIPFSERALRVSALVWCLVAAAGIWIFAWYIAALYGLGVVRGDLDRWNAVLPEGHGYVPGDVRGNVLLGVHLLVALVVTTGGLLQLVPWIRARAAWLHRWNGRLFVVVAMIAAVTGIAIAFTRGAVAGDYMTAGNVLNALLILVFGGLAWREARARRYDAHRRWALRLFIATLSVWFYRVGMMLWFGIHRAPVGHNDAFTGPFDIFLAFGHILLPLAILELYLLADARGGQGARLGMAALLAVSTLAMAGGIVLATVAMWLPRL